MNSLTNLSRVKWACRRGMLELDVLLMKFVDDQFLLLSSSGQEIFVELLTSPDPVLFNWLLGQQTPDREDFAVMVKQIRDHAKSTV